MAHVTRPTIHDVEEISARVVTLEGSTCLVLRLSGTDPISRKQEVARVEFYFPEGSDDYAHRLAAAINTVPVAVPAAAESA